MATWTTQRSGTHNVTSDNASSPWYDGGTQTGWASYPQGTDIANIDTGHTVTVANGATWTLATIRARASDGTTPTTGAIAIAGTATIIADLYAGSAILINLGAQTLTHTGNGYAGDTTGDYVIQVGSSSANLTLNGTYTGGGTYTAYAVFLATSGAATLDFSNATFVGGSAAGAHGLSNNAAQFPSNFTVGGVMGGSVANACGMVLLGAGNVTVLSVDRTGTGQPIGGGTLRFPSGSILPFKDSAGDPLLFYEAGLLPDPGDVREGAFYGNTTDAGNYGTTAGSQEGALVECPQNSALRTGSEYYGAGGTEKDGNIIPVAAEWVVTGNYNYVISGSGNGDAGTYPLSATSYGEGQTDQYNTDIAAMDADAILYGNTLLTVAGNYYPPNNGESPYAADADGVLEGYSFGVGNATAGTGTGGGGIDPGDVVDAKYVLTGHDNYVGGDAGTLTLPADGSKILTTQTAFGVVGELISGTVDLSLYTLLSGITWPGLDQVDGGVQFGPVTGIEYEGTGMNSTTMGQMLDARGVTTANKAQTGDGYGVVSNGTSGNVALLAAINGISVTLSAQDIADIVDGLVDGGLASADALAAVGAVAAAIQAKTDRIGTVGATWTTPATAGGSFDIYAGDDYDADEGRELTVEIEDWAGGSLAGATCKLRLVRAVDYESPDWDGAADLEATATAALAEDGTTMVFTIELTAAQTAALDSGSAANRSDNYVWQLVVTRASGRLSVERAGKATVRRRVGAAS